MASPKILLQDQNDFSVYTKNEERNDNNIVSYIKYMEVHVFGYVIRMDRHKKIYVSKNE